MSKFSELLGLILDKQKKKTEEILDEQKGLRKDLNENSLGLLEIKEQLTELRVELESLRKSLNAISYIVGSHNIILSDLSGVPEGKVAGIQKDSTSAGSLTKLPDLFPKKDDKSN